MRTTISRTELLAFVRSLGANPSLAQHIELGTNEIKVTTYLLDERGHRYPAPGGDGDAATEVTTIAIVGAGDADTVRLRHPTLPGQEINAPAQSVSHYAAAGWEPVSESGSPEPGTEDTDDATGEPEPEPPAPEPDSEDDESTETKPPRGRRKTTKES